ncbi:hypothetical protein [Zavarzinella formosa]|uniref:hypothetical protein n=1 Tax=Zavarzinella formosa TaxID=360055 RepID=UPI001930BA7C|nr:hypothetical protein [Zavarzinella formosa]
MCDLLHFASRVPTVPVQRVIDVSALVAARKEATPRVSWPAIFTKAYSLLCLQSPEFRRAYIEYPWARLYEHPHSIASIAIEREYKGESGVFFAYFPQPDLMTLPALDTAINRQRTEPVEELFAYTFWIYRMPRFLRRLLWWYMINVRGARKTEFIGTFGLSVYSSLGAESLHPLSPLTSTLNYGVIGNDGKVTARIIYDHRVMDGSTVARALIRLEEILNSDILRELKGMAPSVPEQPAREAA